jgi:hypothetical protein
MTLLRRLALKVSGAVVRFASPECREWAEGLEREVAFIEGDWRALGWAIGSTRVLLDRCRTPVGVSSGARGRPSRMDMGWWWVMFLQVSIAAMDFRTSAWMEDRIGWGLYGAGWLYWAVSSVLDWLWERSAPPVSDITATRLFGRARLERRLARYRSIRRWFPSLATIMICTGLVMLLREGNWAAHAVLGMTIAGGCLALWLQSLDKPGRIQGRIEQMDALIARGVEGVDR